MQRTWLYQEFFNNCLTNLHLWCFKSSLIILFRYQNGLQYKLFACGNGICDFICVFWFSRAVIKKKFKNFFFFCLLSNKNLAPPFICNSGFGTWCFICWKANGLSAFVSLASGFFFFLEAEDQTKCSRRKGEECTVKCLCANHCIHGKCFCAFVLACKSVRMKFDLHSIW